MNIPGKPLTISRVASAAKVNVETVRYYQRRGLVREPPKPRQGFRTYLPDTVDRLCFIRRAQELGFTLAEIKNLLMLGDGRCRETRELAERKLSLIHGRVRDLKAMERVLNTLVQACNRHGDAPGCPLIETLSRS
ncbi:MAG TPA: Hg(II)-responsive transcriptional regulator [Gammaproteobacteria bacterium]|nr:Hg(II)-responsive transcriptional regulator [Gammaproteobacteria bacterium]